jgi:hypothetical protein
MNSRPILYFKNGERLLWDAVVNGSKGVSVVVLICVSPFCQRFKNRRTLK